MKIMQFFHKPLILAIAILSTGLIYAAEQTTLEQTTLDVLNEYVAAGEEADRAAFTKAVLKGIKNIENADLVIALEDIKSELNSQTGSVAKINSAVQSAIKTFNTTLGITSAPRQQTTRQAPQASSAAPSSYGSMFDTFFAYNQQSQTQEAQASAQRDTLAKKEAEAKRKAEKVKASLEKQMLDFLKSQEESRTQYAQKNKSDAIGYFLISQYGEFPEHGRNKELETIITSCTNAASEVGRKALCVDVSVRVIAGMITTVRGEQKPLRQSIAIALLKQYEGFVEKMLNTYASYVYNGSLFGRDATINGLRKKKEERFWSFKTAAEQDERLKMFHACIANDDVLGFFRSTELPWVTSEMHAILMEFITPFFERYETREATEMAFEDAIKVIETAAKGK